MESNVTVIVVNWNGEQLLRECLRSVSEAGAILRVQVIVVDNASKDNSVEMVCREFPKVEIIKVGRNLGFGAANNVALCQATGEYVMFLNPDAELGRDTLEAACTFLTKHPDVACVGCLVVDECGIVQPLSIQRDPTPWVEFLRLFLHGPVAKRILARWLPGKEATSSGYVNKLYGSNLVMRSDVARRLGGFDARFFMYCEDVDLCRRIRAAGYKLYYLSETRIRHIQGSCSRSAPRGFSTLMQCESLDAYFRKYNGLLGSLFFRCLMFVGALVRLTLLVGLLGVRRLLRHRTLAANIAAKCFKNWLMLRWSCYSLRPSIPD